MQEQRKPRKQQYSDYDKQKNVLEWPTRPKFTARTSFCLSPSHFWKHLKDSSTFFVRNLFSPWSTYDYLSPSYTSDPWLSGCIKFFILWDSLLGSWILPSTESYNLYYFSKIGRSIWCWAVKNNLQFFYSTWENTAIIARGPFVPQEGTIKTSSQY